MQNNDFVMTCVRGSEWESHKRIIVTWIEESCGCNTYVLKA